MKKLVCFILVLLILPSGILALSPNKVAVPILMYHSISNGKVGKYVVSPKTFENDIKYLKNHGYKSVKIADIVNYVEGNGKLPDKPIAITLDDGNYNFIKYALPILKKYNFIGIISIVGYFTDREANASVRNEHYSSMNERELIKIYDENVEILNHTYNLHHGLAAKKPKNESLQQYYNRVGGDIKKCNTIIKRITKSYPIAFTCPYGNYNSSTIKLCKKLGFKAMLTCNEGVNYLAHGDIQALYQLKRYNRPHGLSLEDFFIKKGIIRRNNG